MPEIDAVERVTVEKLEHGFYRITARYGFMESPNVPEILQRARESGVKAKPNDTTFYLGRERIIIANGERKPESRRAPDDAMLPRMARWRKKLFVHHVAQRALGDGVLRDSAEPGRRAGGAGGVLMTGSGLGHWSQEGHSAIGVTPETQ